MLTLGRVDTVSGQIEDDIRRNLPDQATEDPGVQQVSLGNMTAAEGLTSQAAGVTHRGIEVRALAV